MKRKLIENIQKAEKRQKLSAFSKAERQLVRVPAPAATGSMEGFGHHIRVLKNYKDAICVHGKEWVGQVKVGSTEVAGTAYLEFYINPFEFGGGRLAQFATLYEKYRFTKFKFRFNPSVPTSQKGAVILAYDRDISDPTPPANANGVRQFLAMEGAQTAPVWMPSEILCKLEAPEQGLFMNPVIGGDDRVSYQGQIYVACLEPTALAAGTALGDLVVEYECEMFVPQLEAPPSMLSVNSTGGGFDTSTDILRKFAAGGAATVATGLGNVKWQPIVDSLGKYHIPLSEGLYMIRAVLSQTAAGTINMGANPWSFTANEPAAAPAPQFIRKLVNQNSSSALTDVAVEDSIIAVPRGGGRLYGTASTVTGLSATSVGNLALNSLGGYIDPNTIF